MVVVASAVQCVGLVGVGVGAGRRITHVLQGRLADDDRQSASPDITASSNSISQTQFQNRRHHLDCSGRCKRRPHLASQWFVVTRANSTAEDSQAKMPSCQRLSALMRLTCFFALIHQTFCLKKMYVFVCLVWSHRYWSAKLARHA